MRIHYWHYLVDEEGVPIENAEVYVYKAGTTDTADIFTTESGATPISSEPGDSNVITTDSNGFFEFWIGDEWETSYGYEATQRLDIEWDKDGISGDTLEDVSVFGTGVFSIDETSTDTTRNKTLSNYMAYTWDDRLSTLETSASDHETRITTLETSASDHETRITTLEASASDHETRVTTLEASASDHETRITTLEASASDHETRITTLEASASDHETRISTNEGNITTLQASASDHETRISTNEGNITTLQASASDHETRVTTLETSASDHETRISTNEGNITTLQGLTNYKVLWVPINDMTASTTNGASISTTEYTVNDKTYKYAAFDGSTEEYLEFDKYMPENWDRGTIKAKFMWTTSSSAASGSVDTVEWELSALALSNNETLDTAQGISQVISDTVLAGEETVLHITGATPAITVGGTPALGDLVHFKVSRNVGGTDDMAEDAWLFGVAIQIATTETMTAW